MGKLKRSTAIKRNQKANKNKSTVTTNTKRTIEQLLEYAEDCLDQYELERAYDYVKQALDLDSKDVESLNLMACVQMEMGNCESAKSLYKKLVELKPEEGFSKYMCLAQLSTGQEASDFYKKGIELMLVEYDKQESQPTTSKKSDKNNNEEDEDEEDSQKVRKIDISTAYCSLAELYLTDLCMEDNADQICKSFLDKSLEFDSQNPEALQLMASYWLSKEDNEQAKQNILASIGIWMPKYVEAAGNGPMVDASQVITLSYDSRINTARILSEIQEYDKAADVLDQLIDEDDQVVVIWYMLGWVNYLKGEDYYSNAKFYLKKAKELGIKINYQQRYLDEELKAHVTELLQQLANVASDDEIEEEDKENIDEDNEFETDSEEEREEKNGNDNNMDIV